MQIGNICCDPGLMIVHSGGQELHWGLQQFLNKEYEQRHVSILTNVHSDKPVQPPF